MLIDARELPDGTTIDADICVVGAGPAGLTIARAFASSAVRVTLLESGGEQFSSKVQALYRGEVVGARNHATTHSRFRVYGGSATRWAGQCVPLEPLDFERRSNVPDSGWPFDREHLQPWYQRAAELLRLVDANGFDLAAWEQRVGRLPPIAGEQLAASIIRFAYPRDLGAVLKDELAAAANIRVCLNANVLGVETSADLSRAAAVRFATLDGRSGRCRAGVVVLACGGIENARLLLASNDRAPAGLGNERDLVGRYFMDHPYLRTGYLDSDDPAANAGLHVIEDFATAGLERPAHAVFTLPEDLRRREGLNACVGYFIRCQDYQLRAEYFAPGGVAVSHFADLLRRRRIVDREVATSLADLVRHGRSSAKSVYNLAAARFRSRPRAALRTVLEATPCADSRVTLIDRADALGMPQVRVDWRINDRDWNGLARFREALAQAFAARGVGRLVDDPTLDSSGWPISMIGGKHHMGTTRMHDDPARGVVDSNLRVHSLANLYVAGSSVFPTGGWANPTHTILALSLRLADHLKTRYYSPQVSR